MVVSFTRIHVSCTLMTGKIFLGAYGHGFSVSSSTQFDVSLESFHLYSVADIDSFVSWKQGLFRYSSKIIQADPLTVHGPQSSQPENGNKESVYLTIKGLISLYAVLRALFTASSKKICVGRYNRNKVQESARCSISLHKFWK